MTQCDCCESLESVLESVISRIKPEPLYDDIGTEERDRLAARLADGVGNAAELGESLQMFFALGAGDAMATLAAVRRKATGIKGSEVLRSAEAEIAGMVEAVNAYSTAKTKLPFHIAAATGKLALGEDFDAKYRPVRERLFAGMVERDDKPAARAAAASCPVGSFPRYVGAKFPWKLSSSFSTRMYQRPQDVGCHFRHGPFSGTINGWVSFSSMVSLMVVLQGWGGMLAANNDHLFYKWWALAALGLTPYHCHANLWIRRN